jgi:RNA polymerase sigma-70 factor, ECF subfamily
LTRPRAGAYDPLRNVPTKRPPTLADAFLPYVGEPARSALAAWPPLEAALTSLVREAREAWPALAPADAAFLRHVAERLPAGDRDPASLSRLRAADLCLACACAAHDERAVAALAGALLPDLRALLARRGLPAGLSAEDVEQLTCQKLFVGADGRPPKIGEYAGTGDLRSWARVVMARLVIDLGRGRRDEALHAALGEAADLPSTLDPELEFLKRRYRAEFKAAFEEAAGRLPKRARALLRHRVVFDLSVDQIAAIYHVHRATAARWLADARAALAEGVREALFTRVEADAAQLDSILRLIESQLDLSLPRVLAPPAAENPARPRR